MLDTKKHHLAMASVPRQHWGERYSADQALGTGTIFKDLDMPFFAAEELFFPGAFQEAADKDPVQREREALMLEIQRVSFLLDDLRLYLDTHPEDQEGLAEFKTALEKRKQMKEEFAEKFYPLTPDCMAEIYQKQPLSACFFWQEGPAPWEGGCV